jgi:hypothetical protein
MAHHATNRRREAIQRFLEKQSRGRLTKRPPPNRRVAAGKNIAKADFRPSAMVEEFTFACRGEGNAPPLTLWRQSSVLGC